MEITEIDLFWHNYKFFPYEKKFGLREVESLLKPLDIQEESNKITLKSSENHKLFSQLVYFSHAKINDITLETLQYKCENTLKINEKIRSKRQNTRYSVHGLHEYKGKFNPQVVKSLFNIFNISPGDKILDPFCGSGTSIVEAAHIGVDAIGIDINPLAALIANTKIASLRMPWKDIQDQKCHFFQLYDDLLQRLKFDDKDVRTLYLRSWFPENIFKQIESLKQAAASLDQPIASIFLVLISNILRDYSLQEPSDLRIRRRKSPMPVKPFLEEVKDSMDYFIHNLKSFQLEFGVINSENKAANIAIKEFGKHINTAETFDFAITSPPYATALPYIDTQRLSLIWLGLIETKQIKSLESELTGSRDFNFKQDQEIWKANLNNNILGLPESIHNFCMNLANKLTPADGFRKKALPSLLYRYFYDMQTAFQAVYYQLKTNGYFALIVGHNHTMIGGTRTEIDTPQLLTFLGEKVGFEIHEVTKLEAYQRYGLNATNAVQSESLIVFKK